MCQQDWNFPTSAEIFRSSACLHRSSLSASSFSLRTAQEYFVLGGCFVFFSTVFFSTVGPPVYYYILQAPQKNLVGSACVCCTKPFSLKPHRLSTLQVYNLFCIVFRRRTDSEVMFLHAVLHPSKNFILDGWECCLLVVA